MAYGDGKLRGTEERSASKLPVPVGLAGSTVKLTVLEDEFRAVIIGRVGSRALVGRKDRCRVPVQLVDATRAGTAGVVILTGSSFRQGG